MAESNGNVKSALKYLDKNFDDFKRTLVELSRIPSISAEGFPADEVRRSAEGMAGVLRASGVENVEVLEIPGVHPYVYGDWLHRPGSAWVCSVWMPIERPNLERPAWPSYSLDQTLRLRTSTE